MNISMAEIVGAWCLLMLCGFLYDRLVVDRIERLQPSIGVTAWEVVGGVMFTMMMYGMMAGWENMMLALLMFSASGIPMILGSYRRFSDTIA